MAGSDGGANNLVQDFEESFQRCIAALTEEDDLMDRQPDHIQKQVEENVARFTDLARNLETFFSAEALPYLQSQARNDPQGRHCRAEG